MKKKLLSLLLFLALAALLSTAALAANNPTKVMVGGTNVVTEDISYWKSDGSGGIVEGSVDDYTVMFTPATGDHSAILTLNGANINGGSGEGDEDSGIYFTGAPLELHLIGENYVTKDDGGDSRSAIKAYHNLTITAENVNCSLNVTAKGGTSGNYGIYCSFDTSGFDVNLTVQSGTVYAEAGGDTPKTVSKGVLVNGNLTVSGGRLTGHSTNPAAQSAAGIYVNGSSGGSITVTGGALCALCDAGTYDCNGIYCFRNLNVSGGTVDVRSDKTCIRPDFGKIVLSPDARQVSGVGTDGGVEYNYTKIDCGWLVFLVNNEPLYLTEELMDGCGFDTVTLHTGTNTFEVKNADGYSVIQVDGVDISGSGPFEFTVNTIDSSESIPIGLERNSDKTNINLNIRTLNDKLPKLTTDGTSQTDGDFFLSFINSRSIVQMDKDGNILFYRCEEQKPETVMDTGNVDLSPYGLWDFKQHKVGDTVYYSYHSADVTPTSLHFDGHAPGTRVILNADYSAADTVTAMARSKNGLTKALDGHDFLMLGEDHYLLLQYVQVKANNIPGQTGNRYVTAAYVQERNGDEVVFEWLSTDYPELYNMTATNADKHAADFDNTDAATPMDYVHANSLALDEDGNLLLSCRHLNAALKIDRTSAKGSGRGEILWVLGGTGNTITGVDSSNAPLAQHYFHPLGGGYYSLFSNNNGASLLQSSQMVYHIVKDGEGYALDAADGCTIYKPDAIFDEDEEPTNPFSVACGSFQKLSAVYGLVGWGADLSSSALATEFDLDTGTPTFSIIAADGKSYVKNPANGTYRIVKSAGKTATVFITDQPQSVSDAQGSETLTAKAISTSGIAPAYAWYACDAQGNISGLPVGSGPSFSLSQLNAGTHYFVCLVSDTVSSQVKSSVATVTVPGAAFNSGAPAVTVPVSSNEGSVNLGAAVAGGTATVLITDAQLSEIISNEQNTGTVKIDMSSIEVNEAVIPAKLIAAAAGATGSEGLEVKFSTGSATLDATALESIGSKSVTVSVAAVKPAELTAAQKNILGDTADTSVIVDVNVLVGGVKTSEFNGGLITVSIPYTPKVGEDTGKLVVWYLKDDGSIEPMSGSYNAAAKRYEFTTAHLSTYALTSFPFTDVAADGYYYSAVAWAAANGVTEGAGGEAFDPTGICTRAQMATLLWRAMGSPESAGAACPFADVSADAYYYKAVLWAVENGITEGTGDTAFSPNDTVTRAQVVTFQWRAAGRPAAAVADPFTDVATGAYYEDAVLWAVSQKITEGTTADTFSPADPCTRAQIVTFLYRQLGK